MLDERDKCKSCKGNKVYKDRKVLEVGIDKGMKNGQKIKFSGEADEVPGTLPGDVIIIIQEKEHERFKRKGADLVHSMEITLSEALCGFVKTITHLDGRVLKIESKAGNVLKQDAVKVIAGEGMPFHGNPFSKGRLFVHFTVIFPQTLSLSTVQAIKAVLPRTNDPVLTGEEEECSMTDIDLKQFGNTSEGHRGMNETDDDEDQGRAQPVQCGQA